ncbi:MAG: hypothetical protein MAG451_01098 [Anaerolineales bacterium]|nr:hypothetical protein [Anaerolineales bacterium]
MSEHISERLRQLVEKRAEGQCEYCRLPQTARLLRLTVDHIIAIKHGGPTTESNLALACLTCNLHKGSDIASFDPATGDLTSLYHPREQRWNDHFTLDFETGELRGKTPEGRATVRLLQMNTRERIEERLRLIAIGELTIPFE